MLVAGAFCRASQHEEFQLLVVPQLKTDNMMRYKKSLANQMGSVTITKYLVYGAMAVGACEMLRRFFTPIDRDAITMKDHAELADRVRILEEERKKMSARVHKLEGDKVAPSAHWIPWIKNKAQAFGRKVDEWVPSWMSGVAKMYLLSQATSIVWGKIPQIDRYMGLNPTINWCMFSGTPSFIDALGGFISWYQALHLEPDKHFNPEDQEAALTNINKKSFAVHGHALVTSMEQVLGYMSYVTERLKPTANNYLLLKARSEVCMEAINSDMKELIEMMNAFLLEDPINQQILDIMMNYWHLKVILILDHLENFEPVTLAAGFAERDGRGRFNDIKQFIAPAVRQKPAPEPTKGPLEEMAGDVFSQVVQTIA